MSRGFKLLLVSAVLFLLAAIVLGVRDRSARAACIRGGGVVEERTCPGTPTGPCHGGRGWTSCPQCTTWRCVAR